MKNIHYGKLFIFVAFLFSMTNQVYAASEITVSDAYIKASIPGSDVTASYMTIHNESDKAITLQKVTSTISDRIEIHEHSMVNDMMQMRQVYNINIEANSNVVLKPSGLHLMIFSLKQQLAEPEIVKLTLHFSNETKLNIQLPVYRYK